MASWREIASQQSQDDLDELVDTGLTAAEKQLREHREFYPSAVVRPLDGPGRLVAVAPEGDETTSQEVLDHVWEALRQQREEFRAVGVVSNREAADTDLVVVELEHIEGHAIEVILPYKLQGIRYTPGSLEAREGIQRVW